MMLTPVERHEVNLNAPAATQVALADLEHVADNLRLFGGHCDVTLLQHLVLCVKLAAHSHPGPVFAGYAAAKGLHKVYVGDATTDLKQLVPQLVEIAEAWEAHCHVSLGLVWPRPYTVEHAIRRINLRATELELMHHGHPAAGEMDGGVFDAPTGPESYAVKESLSEDTKHHWRIVTDSIANAAQALSWVGHDMLSQSAFERGA